MLQFVFVNINGKYRLVNGVGTRDEANIRCMIENAAKMQGFRDALVYEHESDEEVQERLRILNMYA